VQGYGGVLRVYGGAVKFESVEISDTSALGVRVAWGGRSGRRRIAAVGAGRRRGGNDAEWGRHVRVCGDLQYICSGARGRGGPIGPEAEWGGGVQNGGVARIEGGSVRFMGGSIARSTAVRDPRRWQLCGLHEVAWGAL
jgi:hypothetical protein